MIFTELRCYGIAENGNSVNSTNKPNTSLERAWRDESKVPNTKYCEKMSYVPLEIRRSSTSCIPVCHGCQLVFVIHSATSCNSSMLWGSFNLLASVSINNNTLINMLTISFHLCQTILHVEDNVLVDTKYVDNEIEYLNL